MSRTLDVLFALLLIAFACFLMISFAYDRLPTSGADFGPNIDAMSVKEFLQYGSIDLNTASQEEFMELYGIGRVLSQRIVEYRTEIGPYRSAEDLLLVKGIGEKRLEMIKKYVYAE